MKKFKIIFSIIIFSLIGYGLLTDREELLPYALLGVGVLMVITGFQELLQDKRKFDGYIFLIGSALFFALGVTYFLS